MHIACSEHQNNLNGREYIRMFKIRYTVKNGRFPGTLLTPHLHDDLCYVVSLSRFKVDYIRVKNEEELPDWITNGYSVRMSNPLVKLHRSPSLISPDSVELFEI